MPGAFELDVRELSRVGGSLCLSNLGVRRLAFLLAGAVWFSSNLITQGMPRAAGLLVSPLRAQWQAWNPVLGMTSGRTEVLRSKAALHRPVASRKMHKPPKIAARMSNGTPRKSCI